MNLYKALGVCTVATLATLPSTLGFVPTPVSFGLDSTTKNGFVAVATDRASMAKPLCMVKFSRDDKSYPEGMSPEEELDYLRQAKDELLAGQDDVPDTDELMQIIAVSQSRTEPDPKDMDDVVDYEVGVLAIPCEVSIAIDVIALGLEAAGLPGGGSKKVSKKMYDKLPRKKKQELAKIIAQMNANNAADKIFEVMKLIYESLSWNALKDSFSSLGWVDAAAFSLSFAGIFASGGVAYIIKLALFGNSIATLIYNISQCPAIVG